MASPFEALGSVWIPGDCTLLPDSPCIDAGTNEGAPAVDITESMRPCAVVRPSTWGAHEFCEAFFRRGDCNDDSATDTSDAVFALGVLFLGDTDPTCDDACDSNDDGALDISDPIVTLQVLYLGSGVIPPPGMSDCGADPTDDELACETPPASCQ